jgi:hypothetical protein
LARLLKQQSSITVYYFPTKETNFCFPFPFAVNKRKFAVSASVSCKQTEVAVQAILLYLFIVQTGNY